MVCIFLQLRIRNMVHKTTVRPSHIEPAGSSTSWDDLRVLLAVHREGSFHGAGRTLRVATSTIARRISQLESSLGRVLVQRTARGTRIEADALSLIEAAEGLEQGLGALGRDTNSAAIVGTVRLSMGEGFVIPATRVIVALQHEHPDLRIELISDSRLVSVSRREADIALRKARSREAELIEKKVGHLQFGLFASPKYFSEAAISGPLDAHQLSAHRFVGFDGSGRDFAQSQWLDKHRVGDSVFRSNSDWAIQTAAQKGLGICLLATSKQHQPVGLDPIAFKGALPRVPIYLVWRRQLAKVPRIRLVAAALERALREALGTD